MMKAPPTVDLNPTPRPFDSSVGVVGGVCVCTSVVLKSDLWWCLNVAVNVIAGLGRIEAFHLSHIIILIWKRMKIDKKIPFIWDLGINRTIVISRKISKEKFDKYLTFFETNSITIKKIWALCIKYLINSLKIPTKT